MATLALDKVGQLVEIRAGLADSRYVGRFPVDISYIPNKTLQIVSLIGFDGTDSFKITYSGSESALITRGTNYTESGIKTAIEAIPGFGLTVVVTNVTDTGFTVQFPLSGSVMSITTTTGVTGTVSATLDAVLFVFKEYNISYRPFITELLINNEIIIDNDSLRAQLEILFA